MGFMLNLTEVIENIKNNQISLLSQIEVSDYEYEDLLKYAYNSVMNLTIRTIIPDDIKLAIALVQIAIREYCEGNYWAYFINTVGTIVNTNQRNYLGQIFLKTIRKYNLYEIKYEGNTRNEFVQNILAHSYITNNYLEGYFDFLFSFYDRNLNREIPDDVDEDIEDLRRYMKEALLSNNDDIELEASHNHPAKSYKLLKSTRTVIVQTDLNAIYDILIKHLFLLDAFYYDYKRPDYNSKFNISFNNWLDKNILDDDERRYNHIRQSGVRNRSIYLKIEKNGNRPFIVIPEQKFRGDITEAEVIIKSKVHENRVYLDLYKALGVIKSDEKQIPIEAENIFEEFKIEIVSKSPVIITNKRYRIFNEHWCELKKLEEGLCYVLVDKNIKFEANENSIIYCDNSVEYWNEYLINVKEDTVLLINDIPLSITEDLEETGLEIYFDKPFGYTITDSVGNPVICTKKHPAIYLKKTKTFLNSNPFIWCNDIQFNIKEYGFITDSAENAEDIYISFPFVELLDKTDGEYKIVMDIPGKGKETICKYLLITNLKCKPEKDFYIFQDSVYIEVQTSYFINSINCLEVNKLTKFEFKLTADKNIAQFSLEIENKKYIINVPVNIFKYYFKKNHWLYKKQDYIWYRDLTNEICLKLPGVTDAEIFLSNNAYYPIRGQHIGEDFIFNIRNIKLKMDSDSFFKDSLNIRYKKNNKIENISLGLMLNHIYESEFNLKYDSKNDEVYINSEFKGNADLCVSIIDTKTNQVVVPQKKLSNGRNNISEIDKNGLYKISKYMSEPNGFFAPNTNKFLETINKIGVIDYLDISNCQVIIKNVVNNGIEVPLYYNYQIAKLKKIDKNKYWGVLYENSNDTYAKRDSIPIWLYTNDENKQKFFISLPNGIEFCYDSHRKKLCNPEDSQIQKYVSRTRDYDRFETSLFSDNTNFEIELKRNR